MFFKNNQNLLIGTVAAGILWLILYYSLVSGNWTTADDNRKIAEEKRQTWINDSKSDKTEKRAGEHKNAFLPRVDAEKRIKKNSDEVAVKQSELKSIEFGNAESLKAFSTAAAGKGGDASNHLNEKIKQAVLRANAQLKVPITSEKNCAGQRPGCQRESAAHGLARPLPDGLQRRGHRADRSGEILAARRASARRLLPKKIRKRRTPPSAPKTKRRRKGRKSKN